MNVGLKALVVVACDAFVLGKDVLAKKNFFLLLPELYQVIADGQAAMTQFGDLKAEIAALPGSEQEADLIAFVQAKFKDVAMDSVKAQAVLGAALKLVESLVQDALALETALKG